MILVKSAKVTWMPRRMTKARAAALHPKAAAPLAAAAAVRKKKSSNPKQDGSGADAVEQQI